MSRLRYEADLGVLPDAAVAEKWGVARRSVLEARRRRGIAPAVAARGGGPGADRVPYDDELGKVPDAEIAAKHGVTAASVGAARRRRLAPPRRTRGRPKIGERVELRLDAESMAKARHIAKRDRIALADVLRQAVIAGLGT